MRIDHLLVTAPLKDRVVWAEIDREARKGKPLPSDHAPPGVCPSNPSLRGKGAAGRCKAAGSKNPEAYSLEYVEECFEPRTTQMLADRLPQ
jgi:hypothetical protein